MRQQSPLRVMVILVLLAIALWVWRFFEIPSLSTFREWADSTGTWFPVVFWLLYVLITQFPIPRTLLTISSGVLFGGWFGILLAITATTASAGLSLTVVRFLLRDWVESKISHPKLHMINERLEQRGWLAVMSLRLIPGIPFSVMNYASALSRVRLLPFMGATLIGSAPNTILVALFGDTLSGDANPVLLGAVFALSVLGVTGLIIDARHPAKPRRIEE
ncbi:MULTISPECIES: TVP38/TMEM64 family protein [unclassified Corynebacterium]|uniref:TVP38/TMEM64 family protein n=1 Tax=unclassified Corynebacterium TaxID=2624378 RepID=UPI0008D921DE|nr:MULTISPECIES: TVP38/TMEM64 family protein [unclassified Corynebacterium]